MFGHDNNKQDDNAQSAQSHHDDQTQHDNAVPSFLDSLQDSKESAHSASPAYALSPDTTPSDATSTNPAVPAIDVSDDELLDIKRDALEELAPLVGHLDQSIEEKFKTTMMMIQATDDPSLIKTAYETAKQITDEKVRAQALLDIVNEINYFTQHSIGSEDAA